MSRGVDDRTAADNRGCNCDVRRRASDALDVEGAAARAERTTCACLKMVRWNIMNEVAIGVGNEEADRL